MLSVQAKCFRLLPSSINHPTLNCHENLACRKGSLEGMTRLLVRYALSTEKTASCTTKSEDRVILIELPTELVQLKPQQQGFIRTLHYTPPNGGNVKRLGESFDRTQLFEHCMPKRTITETGAG